MASRPGFKRVDWSQDLSWYPDAVFFQDPNGMSLYFEVTREQARGIDHWSRGGIALEDACPSLTPLQIENLTRGTGSS